MKRFIAVFLSLTIILSALIFSPTVLAEQSAPAGDYGWTGTTQVYSASKGARYFRTKKLSDGSIGAVYYRSGLGNYFAKSYDGGLSFTDEVLLLPNATDSLIENSPYVDDKNPLGRGRLEAQNPNFTELPNGNIMVFHRYNTYTGAPTEKPWSFYYSSICYQTSKDGGVSWSEPKVMVECRREKALESTSDYGFWEPDPYLINGKLFVYYADTNTPNNLNYQHIMYCVWDEETQSFSKPEIAQNGIDHRSRDGMSVVAKLCDGSYAMVFESTKTGNTDNTFVIKMSLSKDGADWSHPVIVASPNKVLDKTAASSGEKAVCASPHIITLPDGRVAISYQTTDRYSGVIPDRVSYRVGTQVAVSKTAITYESFADNEAFADKSNNANMTEFFTELPDGPDKLEAGEFSKSASMLYANGYLMVYYNIGNNTDAYTHSIGAINVSYAKIGVATDYSSINSYIAFNKNNAEIKAQNGSFTLPSSTSTMLAANKNATIKLSDLYNSENYILYSGGSYTAAFDSDNKNITTTSTGKAMLRNTEHLTSFTASATVSGNPTTGAMQGGFGFHIKSSDFQTNYFNTSGYSVFVRRLTSNLSKVEIAYRYCTKGASVYSYIAGSYDGLPEDALDLKFNLKLVVNGDKFYAQLLDENGKVIINAKEAPLNETASDKKPDYYPVGSLALISHGKHTFSDITVTETAELIKTDYLKAHGVFTMSASGDNQFGFALRAQSSVNESPGYCGYVVKLVKSDTTANGVIRLQLTRYGTDSSGTRYVNLGNIKTFTDTTVLNGVHASGATVMMDAVAEGSTLTVTLTNPQNRELTSIYTFDLTAASGSYTDYYANGGFGVFNHSSSEVTVSDLQFSTEKESINTINDTDFTAYEPEDSNSLKYEYNSYLATASSGKKIMLKDTFAADFSADATFEIGSDGKLKSGIIFRSQSIGNGMDDLEGYSVCVIRNGDNSNKGRMQLVVFKWVRTAKGVLAYYGLMKRIYDTTSLNSVIPEAKTSMLAGSGTRVKLYVDVTGNDVSAYFELLSQDNTVTATSKTLTYDLTTERIPSSSGKFTYDGANTLFGAGQIGISMNQKERFCDFNITVKDTEDISDKIITTEYNRNGLAYTTLCGGAAETGSLIKVIPLANEGSRLSAIFITADGKTQELLPVNGEYKFTKTDKATHISAVFKIIGDLNGDESINATDLVNMRAFLLGKIELRLNDGDLNQSGSIDIIDLVRLKKLAI